MSNCIIWSGAVSGSGYGNASVDGRTVGAHRVAYCASVGISPAELPSSVIVRHICDVKLCVNPEHLRPGTPLDNYRDQVERGHRPPLVTHCVHGHEYSEANTYTDKRGRRHCRECDRLRSRKAYGQPTKRGRYKTKNNPNGAESRGT